MSDTRDRRALVVVDMQNAFTSPTGVLAVPGADKVVTAVNGHVAAAYEAGHPVFLTRDVAPARLPEGAQDHQFDLDPGLDLRGVVVQKGPGAEGGFSGFVLDTGENPGEGRLGPLAGLLRATDVSSLLVVGLAADVCVAATARDARRLGYRVTVDLDASAFVHAHPDGDAAAVAELVSAGVTVVGTRPTSGAGDQPPPADGRPVLILGRSAAVQRELTGQLRSAGVTAHASTEAEYAVERYDARDYALIVFGAGIVGPLSEGLRAEFTRRDPGVRFLDSFAPIAVRQILAELRRGEGARDDAVRDARLDEHQVPAGGGATLTATVTRPCHLRAELHHYAALPPGPGDPVRWVTVLDDRRVPAGDYRVPVDAAQYSHPLMVVLTADSTEFHLCRPAALPV